jgi:hypothetical protein
MHGGENKHIPNPMRSLLAMCDPFLFRLVFGSNDAAIENMQVAW